MQYELFYLVGERQESKLDEIKKGVEALLVSEKATLVEPEVLEKRKLAYEIKHQRKGTYITRRFDLPDFDEIQEKDEKEFGVEAITKKLNLNSDVLRFLIVKTEDLPDLGAKERRKAQEMSASKQTFSKSDARSEQKQPAAFKKPQPKTVIEKESKKEVKDIDQQLDKLLDI